jgi:membrane protein
MLQKIFDYIWNYKVSDGDTPHSSWRLFLQIMAVIGRDLMEGMLTLRAMSLVFTTLLSLVPLLAVSISVLKGFGVHDQLEPALVRLLEPLGEQSVEISARIVGFVENMKIGVLGAVGLSLLIFSAISLIQKIESAFNHTWRLQASRTLLQRFSDYLSVILVGPVLIFSAVGITATLASNELVNVINALPYMGDVVRFSGKILPYVLVIAAFTFVYMLVPNTRVHLRSALYGAVIAGLMWQSAGVLFTSFIGGATKYTAIYSGFAILLTFMIWVYLSWLILLIGASISYYHQHPERLKWRDTSMHLSARLREQLGLQVMVNIARAYDQQSDMLPTLENLAAYQRVPFELLSRMLKALEADGLVTQSADSPSLYLPGRALKRIKLAHILRSSRYAEDDSQSDGFRSDVPVSKLLENFEEEFESRLGEHNLAQFLDNFESSNSDEDSLV